MKDNYNNFLEFCAIENAIKFNGKTNPKALIGKVLGKYPDKKNDMKSLIGDINNICDKINNIDLDTQKKEFLKYTDMQKQKEESLDIKKKIKAIVFDVDGVITNTSFEIEQKEKEIFENYNLNYEDFTPYLFSGQRNKIPLESKLKKEILEKCENICISSELNEIENVINFIKENHEKYLFFTNTALVKNVIEKRFNKLDLHKYFKELFHSESGGKKENIIKVLEKYNLKNDEILFIDDKISNIQIVRDLNINTIHFTDHNLNIDEEIERAEKILNFSEVERAEKNNKIKAIIFDFDGVIHDTKELGFKIHNKVSKKKFSKPEDWINTYFNGNVLKKVKKDFHEESHNKFREEEYEEFKRLKVEREIFNNLKDLKEDYKLFIVTSNSIKNINLYNKNNGMENFFEEILAAEDDFCKYEKITKILNNYNLKNDEVIFITDTVGDIIEAKKADIKIIAVSFGFQKKEDLEKENPFSIIDSFSQIKNEIEKIEEKSLKKIN